MNSGPGLARPDIWNSPRSCPAWDWEWRQRVPLRAADAGRGRNVSAGDLRNHPLDRPARRELNDGKADQHDPEQGRDDQQGAFQQVGGHRRTAWLASV